MTGTVAAIERELCRDGFVQRYTMTKRAAGVDGLPPGEGAFLPCTFWLADAYLHAGRRAPGAGRREEGRALFERLLGLRNDLGLLSRSTTSRPSGSSATFPRLSATSRW